MRTVRSNPSPHIIPPLARRIASMSVTLEPAATLAGLDFSSGSAREAALRPAQHGSRLAGLPLSCNVHVKQVSGIAYCAPLDPLQCPAISSFNTASLRSLWLVI